MAISRRLRYEVLRRDNHACRYWGACAPDAALTVDHVVPVALGGGDEPSNLVAACKDCNAGKSASNPDGPLVADVRRDAERWAFAMKHVVQTHAETLGRLNAYLDDVDTVWCEWKVTATQKELPRPADWRGSAETFMRNHVSIEEWEYAVRRAMEHRKLSPDAIWTYTCGVLWRRIRERTEAAAYVASQLEADEQEMDD